MELGAGVSKQALRQQVWDFMEAHDLADFPRPVHGRIPNFKGSSRAAEHLLHLEAFRSARTVKVNPDAPQRNARFLVLEEIKVDPDKPLEGARLLALQSKKTLLVPTPRLRTGLFNRVVPPPGAAKAVLRTCATAQGVRSYSVPVGLDSRAQVDLLVVGSVAVSEKGWRIGKGEGYADLEYAMMVAMGAVSPETPVLTIVHDCQVLDFPEALLEDHDLTVDFILTPTRLLATGCARPKPRGVTWAKISADMLARIPVLRSLRAREQQAGKDVTLQAEPRQSPGVGRGRATHPGPRGERMRPPREGALRVLGAWAGPPRLCVSPSCTARGQPARGPAPACTARLGTSDPRMTLPAARPCPREVPT